MAFTHVTAELVYNPFQFLGSMKNDGDLTFISGWLTRYFCISEELLSRGSSCQCKLRVTGRFLHPPFSEHLGRSSAGVNQCSCAVTPAEYLAHLSYSSSNIKNTFAFYVSSNIYIIFFGQFYFLVEISLPHRDGCK